MDTMEPQKSDSSTLSGAASRFASADLPLTEVEAFIRNTANQFWEDYKLRDLGMKGSFVRMIEEAMHAMARNLVLMNENRGTFVSTDVLTTLRNVVDGYISKTRDLEAENKQLREQLQVQMSRPYAPQDTDAVKFNAIREFEGDQATLIKLVSDAQEESRKLQWQTQAQDNTIRKQQTQIEQLEARVEAAVVDVDLQYAANKELVRLNRRYQQERDQAEERERLLRAALEQQKRYPQFSDVGGGGYVWGAGPRDFEYKGAHFNANQYLETNGTREP